MTEGIQDRSTKPEEVTALFGGRLALRQPSRGHRAGTDAVLLARALGDPGLVHAVDLGAGTGAVGLGLCRLYPQVRATLVEIDPELAALARDNGAANHLESRVAVVVADVLAPRWRLPVLPAGSVDLVLTNPPYLDGTASRVSPDRARAHAMPPGGLPLWLRRGAALLKPGGRLVVIHRADALKALLEAWPAGMGRIYIRPIAPRADAPAHRMLVAGLKGSRAPLVLLPPLILHGADGRFTPEVEALHRGEPTAALLP